MFDDLCVLFVGDSDKIWPPGIIIKDAGHGKEYGTQKGTLHSPLNYQRVLHCCADTTAGHTVSRPVSSVSKPRHFLLDLRRVE